MFSVFTFAFLLWFFLLLCITAALIVCVCVFCWSLSFIFHMTTFFHRFIPYTVLSAFLRISIAANYTATFNMFFFSFFNHSYTSSLRTPTMLAPLSALKCWWCAAAAAADVVAAISTGAAIDCCFRCFQIESNTHPMGIAEELFMELPETIGNSISW